MVYLFEGFLHPPDFDVSTGRVTLRVNGLLQKTFAIHPQKIDAMRTIVGYGVTNTATKSDR